MDDLTRERFGPIDRELTRHEDSADAIRQRRLDLCGEAEIVEDTEWSYVTKLRAIRRDRLLVRAIRRQS